MNKLFAVTQLALCFVLMFCISSSGQTRPPELAGQWEYATGDYYQRGIKPDNVELFKDGTGILDGNTISWKVEGKRLVILSSTLGFACEYKVSGYELAVTYDGGRGAIFVKKGRLGDFKAKQVKAAEAAAEKERNDLIASFEETGDKAYEMAKRTTEGERLKQLKTAYMYYDKAVKSNPNKISNKLRERYLDMCITRVQLILDEGATSMSAFSLIQNDIDTYLTTNVPADIRQRYATFLAQLGDSSVSKANYVEAISYYNKAIEKAANSTPFKAKQAAVKAEQAAVVDAEKAKQSAATETEKVKIEQLPKFTDNRDSKVYRKVQIGTQTWMAENLNYAAEGSKCYENNESNCAKYGRLYNWATAKQACPTGWHLPADAEWTTLVNYAGGAGTAGKKLKSASGWPTTDWGENLNGTNDYGFSALPGGSGFSDNKFEGGGRAGTWWSATKNNAGYIWFRSIQYGHGDGVGGERESRADSDERCDHSVRCVQD
jgi:uncharacterized protein (TIGR02145 family)